MIFPGHVAASALCHRYLRLPLPMVMVAGVAPDLIDKACFYLLRISPSSRVPMHTLLGWLVSSVVVALVGWLVARTWRAGVAWSVGFGAHLVCDSPLAGGDLPFLYPFRQYAFRSDPVPLSYLWRGGDWPMHMLLSELLLVVVAVWLLRRNRGPARDVTISSTAPARSIGEGTE